MTLFTPDTASVARNSTAGVQLALLEFYLLGTTSDLVLHSKGSSFAVEASYLRPDRPVGVVDMTTMPAAADGEGVTDSPLNVYKHDIRLPFCGMDDFYNAHMEHRSEASSSGLARTYDLADNAHTWPRRRVCYRDGATEQEEPRLLCTYLQTVFSNCDLISEVWGIANLYCSSNSTSTSGRLDDLDSSCLMESELISTTPSSPSSSSSSTAEPPSSLCVLTESRGY